jgi:hypothetical protein
MSSTSADFKTVNVTDPRLHFDDQINYAVRGGASAISSVTFPAQAKSLTSHSFQINIPSLNTVVSKRVLWKSTVVYKVTGTVTNLGDYLVEYGKNVAPSAYPLHQSCITQTCQINSNTISINTRDVLIPLLRMQNKDIINDLNSMTPNQLDNIAEYEDAFNGGTLDPYYNNVLGDAKNSSEYWRPRGSFRLNKIGSICTDGVVSGAVTPAPGINSPITTYIEFEFTEPLLMLSPFTCFDAQSGGLFGIQNLSFNFTLESERCRAIRMANLGRVQDATVSVVSYNSSELQFEFLSCHDTTVLPSRCISNYYEVPRYILASSVSIPSRTTKSIVFNTFSLNQIPDMLVIYARKKVADQTIYDSDLNLSIRNINLNFNNNSGLISSHSVEQLYNISRKNNVNVTWDEYYGLTNSIVNSATLNNIGTIGSPLVLKFGEDIPLSNTYLAPGSMGQFSIQFNLEVFNQSNSAITPEVVMIAVNSGLFVSYSGSSSIYSGILSKSDVINCKMNEEPVSETDIRRLVGHGFMDKLKRMPSSVVNFLGQHHKVLGALAKKGLNTYLPDNKYAKLGSQGLAMLGYGEGAGDSGGSRSGGALRRHTRK